MRQYVTIVTDNGVVCRSLFALASPDMLFLADVRLHVPFIHSMHVLVGAPICVYQGIVYVCMLSITSSVRKLYEL